MCVYCYHNFHHHPRFTGLLCVLPADIRVHYIMFPEPIKRDRNSIWHLGSWGFKWPEWRQAKIPQSVRPTTVSRGQASRRSPDPIGSDRERDSQSDEIRTSYRSLGGGRLKIETNTIVYNGFYREDGRHGGVQGIYVNEILGDYRVGGYRGYITGSKGLLEPGKLPICSPNATTPCLSMSYRLHVPSLHEPYNKC